MRRKLTVSTPYGTVTRTTERDYQFVVVSMGQSEAYLRSQHAAYTAHQAKLAAGYRKAEASGGMDTPDARDRGRWPVATWAEWADRAEKAAASPFVMPEDHMVTHGWSGSQRGAASMVATAQKHGYTGILVVPVAPPAPTVDATTAPSNQDGYRLRDEEAAAEALGYAPEARERSDEDDERAYAASQDGVRHPEIIVQLVVTDGNAFAVLGAMSRAMRRAGLSLAERDEFLAEATAGDYNHLLATCMRWVEVQ
jgi:hypothetical protein